MTLLINRLRAENDECWGGRHCGPTPETSCFSCLVKQAANRLEVLEELAALLAAKRKKESAI